MQLLRSVCLTIFPLERVNTYNYPPTQRQEKYTTMFIDLLHIQVMHTFSGRSLLRVRWIIHQELLSKCSEVSLGQSVGTKNIHETPYIAACQQETSLCLINKVRQIMNKGQLLLITTFNKNHAYLVCLWIMISNFNRLWKTWGKPLTGNSTQLPCSISSQATILVALPCRHVCDWNLFSHNRTGL